MKLEYEKLIADLITLKHQKDVSIITLINDLLSVEAKLIEEKYGSGPFFTEEETRSEQEILDAKARHYENFRKIFNSLGYFNLHKFFEAVERNGRQNELYFELEYFLKKKLSAKIESDEYLFLREDLIRDINGHEEPNHHVFLSHVINFFDSKGLLDLLLLYVVERRNEFVGEEDSYSWYDTHCRDAGANITMEQDRYDQYDGCPLCHSTPCMCSDTDPE